MNQQRESSASGHRLDGDHRSSSSPPPLRSMLWALLLGSIALAAADLLVTTITVLLLVFAGMLFGVFLNGITSWLTRWLPLRYQTTYGVVVLLLFVLIGLGGFHLGSQVAQRVNDLAGQLQEAVQSASDQIRQVQWLQQYLPEGETFSSLMLSNDTAVLPQIMKGMTWVSWGLTAALVILFVGLYAAYDPELYRVGLVKLVPPRRRDRAMEVLEQLRYAMQHWLIGRFVSMALVGIATAIGLSIFGVAMPITLGVVAALLTFIPNIGPLLAAAPQALLALNVSTNTALYVILFNLALQTVESYLITPMIQQHEVTLPPILTIAAQLVMGVIAGVIGVMVAAPLVVMILVTVQMLYIHDRLGDSHPGALAESG